MRKPLSPALCVLLTTCNHDPEAYIPHREMAGLSGLSQSSSTDAAAPQVALTLWNLRLVRHLLFIFTQKKGVPTLLHTTVYRCPHEVSPAYAWSQARSTQAFIPLEQSVFSEEWFMHFNCLNTENVSLTAHTHKQTHYICKTVTGINYSCESFYCQFLYFSSVL